MVVGVEAAQSGGEAEGSWFEPRQNVEGVLVAGGGARTP